jgi:alanyl-tRNA synthetase
VHDKIAHTAEHAFIGSLQKKLGQVLQVRKVEHKKSGNTAFIVTPQLELQTVLDAQADVNSLIQSGRKVTERSFASLEEAREALPGLRANEERISGEVRVIEIENHDLAACAMEHAKDLKECDFFLVTRLSKSGSEHEVDFAVGQQAKEMSSLISEKLMRVCGELGANINTVENTAKKLKSDLDSNRAKLRALGSEKLQGIPDRKIGRFLFVKGAFGNLDDEQLTEFAGEKISSADVVVLVANASPENAKVVFARNEKMHGPDCSAIFKQIVGGDGRGGGKPHFATGVVRNEALSRVLGDIEDELVKHSNG